MTDYQLAMIEQLTYLNGDVLKAAGLDYLLDPDNLNKFITEYHKGQSINNILSVFDEAALKRLASQGKALGSNETPMGASGAEWASIIKQLQSDKDISNLILSDTMASGDNILALTFYDKFKPNKGIVAFRGTTGGAEWIDNVEGLNRSDTKSQKEALDWIESLRFSDITVVGHSKGGNKAMYVSILSDKVTRCVSMDGQGFSQEFLDKYWAEIQTKGGLISNYSVSTDFVNILMFPIPGANLIFIKGDEIYSVGENHAPNSFFRMDKSGNLLLDARGRPQMVITAQDESLAMLHEFVSFVMNVADADDKKLLVEFISQLLAMMFANPKASMDDMMKYLIKNSKSLEKIIAYLVKYMDVYDLNSEDINKLLKVLGLDSLDDMFSFKVIGIKIVGLSGLLDYAKKQLSDGKSDNITEFVLSYIDFEGINGKDFWRSIESNINEIGKVNSATAKRNATAKTGRVRNFSKDAYEALINTISRFENNGFEGVSSWNNFSSEDWYSSLFINTAVRGINTYRNKLTETSSKCKTQIDAIFNNVSQIDEKYGNKINSDNVDMKIMRMTITKIANSIA